MRSSRAQRYRHSGWIPSSPAISTFDRPLSRTKRMASSLNARLKRRRCRLAPMPHLLLVRIPAYLGVHEIGGIPTGVHRERVGAGQALGVDGDVEAQRRGGWYERMMSRSVAGR